MGYGDDLMGTGLARAVRDEYPHAKMVFGDPDNYHNPKDNRLNVHYTEMFQHNPIIVQENEPVKDLVCVPDYPGHRVYVDYENSEIDDEGKILRFKWREEYTAPKGEIYFTDDEKSEASEIALRLPYPFFVLEPNVAEKPWINHKSWPLERWQEVVDALAGEVFFVQFSGDNVLRGVHHVQTPSFRQACAILGTAGAFVGTDGGLHHAAAALDIPAVVLWGHYSSPGVFGYDDHWNIRHVDNIGCGSAWVECSECPESMEKITVDEVVTAIKELMDNGRHIISRKGNKRPAFRMVGSSPKGAEK
jgi:hypothetical protein